MTAGYDVNVERDECLSSGKCVAAVPGFFVFDNEELVALAPDGDKPDDETLLRVARACPSGAIHLHQDGDEVDL